MEELFVEVVGYPNYSVSNYGNVVNTKYERDLQCWECDGKLMVKLYRNGIPKNFFVHRLVAQAFFVDYDDKVEVHHITPNKHDNSVTNLHLLSPVNWDEPITVREL